MVTQASVQSLVRALARIVTQAQVVVRLLVQVRAQAPVQAAARALVQAQVPTQAVAQALIQVQALARALAVSAYPVPPLSVAYKFSVSFYKTSITGDNRTIGRPNLRFFQPFDHNWGTFALNTSLP